MGPVMAVARPIAALASAVTAGTLSLLLAPRDDPGQIHRPESPAEAATGSCCHCAHDAPTPAAPPKPACCASGNAERAPTEADASDGALPRLGRGIRYAFTTLLDDLAPWLAFGLVLAGALAALVPPDAMAEWGRGPLAMLAMALIGVPIYVCATSYTPVGASLILAGVSPGAVLVLLLAGPATNIGTIGIVRRELGTRAVFAYLFGVVGVSIAAGLGLDAIVSAADLPIAEHAAHAHEIFPAWLSIGATATLAFFAIRPLRRAAALFMPAFRAA